LVLCGFVVVVEMEEGWGGVFIGVGMVEGASGPEAAWFFLGAASLWNLSSPGETVTPLDEAAVLSVPVFTTCMFVPVQLYRSENGFTTSSFCGSDRFVRQAILIFVLS
jgi:hypothetical protein